MSIPSERLGSLLTKELLDTLSAAFPHRCPNPNDSTAEMWMKAGERRLVDILIAKFNEAYEGNSVLNPLLNQD